MKLPRFVIGLLAALASSFAIAAEPLRFTVVGIDCEACGPPIVRALKAVPGVKNPKVDWKAGSASVEVPDGFDREKIRTALKDAGFEAIFPGEKRPDLEPVSEEVRKTLDIASASEEEKVDLSTALVPGKVTVVDYWAEWCSPCHLLAVRLEHLVHENRTVAVRRVNVGKWDNAAAKQATSEYHLESLPYVRVYDARGRFVGAETGGAWDKIVRLVEKAKSQG